MAQPPASPGNPGDSPPTRRRLLSRWSWIAGLGVLLGGQLWLLLKLIFAPLTPEERGGEFSAGPLENFAVGSVTHLRPKQLFVARLPTTVLALSHNCTHQDCVLGYVPERQVLLCPCHGAQFSLTGEVLSGPAPRPLDRYTVMVRAGQVIIDTAQRHRMPTTPG